MPVIKKLISYIFFCFYFFISDKCFSIEIKNFIKLPDHVKTLMVFEKMKINGIDSFVFILESKNKDFNFVENFKLFWQEKNNENMPRYLIDKVDGFEIVSRVDKNNLITLQVKKDFKSNLADKNTAILSIAHLSENNDFLRFDEKLTDDFDQILSEIETKDLGKKSKIITFFDRRKINNFSKNLEKNLLSEGWMISNHEAIEDKSRLLIAIKDGDIFQLFLTDNGQFTSGVVVYEKNSRAKFN